MKKFYFLPLISTAILFTACQLPIPSPDARRTDGNQSNRSGNQTAGKDAPAAESKDNANLKSTFANIENEGTNLPMEKATPAQKTNAVCPHPDKPCRHKEKEFAEWELPFRLPAKITPNKTYSSAPFYAVMLETYESDDDCDGGEYIEAVERKRKRMQNMQLERKVFASYSCPNMDAVGYDFAGQKDASGEQFLIMNFLAVYAGETKEDAEMLLRSVRDEYPNAVVKRMTAQWERIEQ